MEKLKILDLFSGIGGFSLGLERTGGFETVAFCEYDKKARLVINKHWPDVPIYEDVRTLEHEGTVDVITGGYPCQPFSLAGKRKGKEDDRHLWPAMFDLIKKHRPTWVIGENVAGHIDMGLDSVLTDLADEGYGVRTFVIPACAVNAPHRRDRLWIVAHTDSNDRGRRCSTKSQGRNTRMEHGGGSNGQPIEKSCENVAYSESSQRHGDENDRRDGGSTSQGIPRKHNSSPTLKSGEEGARWEVEPGVGRVADGLPGYVDRLRQLGNAVVPQIPEIIGNAILETYK